MAGALDHRALHEEGSSTTRTRALSTEATGHVTSDHHGRLSIYRYLVGLPPHTTLREIWPTSCKPNTSSQATGASQSSSSSWHAGTEVGWSNQGIQRTGEKVILSGAAENSCRYSQCVCKTRYSSSHLGGTAGERAFCRVPHRLADVHTGTASTGSHQNSALGHTVPVGILHVDPISGIFLVP
eukprot:scaffold1061_cov213-Prasinococcus_capsulatus_cf.AAC.7